MKLDIISIYFIIVKQKRLKMAIKGFLSDISLSDILQLVATSGKSGKFILKKGELTGTIYLDKGAIVHAELPGENLIGEDAIYRMAAWKEGEFEFVSDTNIPAKTVKKSVTNILMETARIIDEWNVLKNKIPSEDAVPKFAELDKEEKARITLNTLQWIAISKVDGKKSIRDIAYELQMSVFEVAKLFYDLVANGLIEMVPKRK